MKYSFVLLISIAFMSSCAKNSVEALNNSASCDTSNVKFSKIGPIIVNDCSSSSCHGGGQSPQLVTYNDISTYAESSLAAMTRTSNTMPKGGSKLDDCTINKFTSWINNGKLNN